MSEISQNFVINRLNGSFADESKIALLGPSNSGKTTFKNQIICFSDPGFSEKEMEDFQYVIKDNIVSLAHQLNKVIEEKGIEIKENQKNTLEFLLDYKADTCDFDSEMCYNIKKLFGNKELRKIVEDLADIQFPNVFDFTEELEILLTSVELSPNVIAKTRVRSIGFSKQPFIYNGKIIQMIDVAGSLMERNKSKLIVEEAPKIIFFANLADFDLKMYEKEDKTRFEDTLQYFKSVYDDENNKNKTIRLVLTHLDRLEKRIANSDCFKKYFNDYEGNPQNAMECANFLSSKLLESTERQIKVTICNLLNENESKDLMLKILNE